MSPYPKTSTDRWFQQSFDDPGDPPNRSISPHPHPQLWHQEEREKEEGEEEDRILTSLLEAFPSVSLEEIASAYTQADGNPDFAAELLASSRSSSRGLTDCDLEAASLVKAGAFVGAWRSTASLGGPGGSHQLAEFFPNSGKISYADLKFSRNSFAESLNAQEQSFSSINGKAAADALFANDSDYFPPLSQKSASPILCSPTTKRSPLSRKASAASGTVSNARLRGNGIGFNTGMRHNGIIGRSQSFYYDDCSSSDGTEGVSKRNMMRQRKNAARQELCDMTPNDQVQRVAVEDFLFSMLGDGFELGIDVVQDVLGHFNGDIQKSLDTLLHMAATTSSFNCDNKSAVESLSSNLECSDSFQLVNGDHENNIHPDPLYGLIEAFPKQDPLHVVKVFESCNGDFERATVVLLGENECNKSDSMNENTVFQDLEESMLKQDNSSMKWVIDILHKEFPCVEMSTLFEVLRTTNFDYSCAMSLLLEAGIEPSSTKSVQKNNHADLSKLVLQSLFNSKEKEKDSSDQQAQKLGKKTEKTPQFKWMTVERTSVDHVPELKTTLLESSSYGDWDDYERHRESAKQLWGTMECYFKEAAAAYTKGEHARAALLSEKGKMFKELAKEANKRASARIFHVKNQDLENDITIDLHAQHVEEGLRLLKLHLKSLAPIPSVHTLTVITGSGSHSASGRSKVKEAVMQYLERKGIDWSETNPGCLVIKLNDVKFRS